MENLTLQELHRNLSDHVKYESEYQHRFEEKLDAILLQVTRTNGRVNTLEIWKDKEAHPIVEDYRDKNVFPMFLEILRYVAALFATIYLSINFPVYVNSIGYIVNILVLLGIPLTYYFGGYYEKNYGRDAGDNLTQIKGFFKLTMVVFSVVTNIVIALAGFEYLRFLTKINAPFIPNARLAGLMLALYFVLIVLSRSKAKAPTVFSLIKLRRGYLQGEFDASELIRRVSIVLSGLKYSDLLQEDVSRILSLLQKTDLEFAAIIKKENVLEKIYNKQSSNISEDDEVRKEILVSDILDHFLNITKYQNVMKNEAMKRFVLVKGGIIDDKQASELVEKIQILFDDLKIKFRFVSDRLIAMLETYESKDRLAVWNKKMEGVYIYEVILTRETKRNAKS